MRPAVERTNLEQERVAESTLVTRIRAGDRDAFAQMFNAHYSALRAFALTLIRSPADAEELVQDVFFRLWKNRVTWVLQTSLKSYLFIAVRNAASAHRRHARIVERVASGAESAGEALGMSSGAGPTDRRVESAEIAEAFARAVERLPERCRQVVILRWQHGMSHAEVADVMGVTVKAVERQLTRAGKTLRVELAGFVG